jgi:hypothetical protein
MPARKLPPYFGCQRSKGPSAGGAAETYSQQKGATQFDVLVRVLR